MMRKRNKISIGLLFFMGSVFYGCYYDNVDDLYGYEPCDVSNVTYTETIEPIISNNCAVSGCHVPGNERVLLTNYEEIKEIADSGDLRDRVIVKKDMPETGPLARCEIEEIDAWLSAGAPNN